MINRSEVRKAQRRAARMLDEAGIFISSAESESIEVVEFGLGELERTGLALLVYVNNDRYCAKELIMFPRQSCPEHRHPSVGSDPGKRETFRCRWGKVYLYVEGPRSCSIAARIPKGSEQHYTVFHEVVLSPGEQHTIEPDIKHWFQAGDDGAIVSEFSATSRDEADIFTDPRIARIPEIVEDC